MNRREWLTRTSLALAGGLVVGDAVLEEFERLTHKKVFALGGLQPNGNRCLELTVDGKRTLYQVFREEDLQRIVRESYQAWQRSMRMTVCMLSSTHSTATREYPAHDL